MVSKGRGRPKKNGSKLRNINIRVTDEQLSELKYVCRVDNKSMTDVLLKGIKMQANLCKFKEQNPDSNLNIDMDGD